MKSYTVQFATTSQGSRGVPIRASLAAAHAEHGAHLPPIDFEGHHYQVRDLQRVGRVWRGVFGKLRPDALHIVSARGTEREVPMSDGDRLIEKCHFLYRETTNVLVWQVNRNAAGISKAQVYFGRLFEESVALPLVMNEDDLNRALDGQVYEISFDFARPTQLGDGAPRWRRGAFDMMANVEAAQAKFLLRAPRRGSLAESAKAVIRQLVSGPESSKIRVRMTDDDDPVELFMAPLRDTIRVNLAGRYPVVDEVYQGLEDAYSRNRSRIPSPDL